jgi:hypothetical protein
MAELPTASAVAHYASGALQFEPRQPRRTSSACCGP